MVVRAISLCRRSAVGQLGRLPFTDLWGASDRRGVNGKTGATPHVGDCKLGSVDSLLRNYPHSVIGRELAKELIPLGLTGLTFHHTGGVDEPEGIRPA